MNYQIELHNFCNFSCGYCPHRDMKRKQEFMSDEVWQAILNRYLVPYRHLNAFCPPTFIGHKDTEPLIDKKLPSRLRDLANVAPDMKIDIYSNGVLLPKWRERGADFMEFLATLPNKVRYMMSYHPHNHDDSVNDYAATIAYLKDVLRNPPANVEFITVSHQSKWTSPEVQNAWSETWVPEVTRGVLTVHKNVSINPWTGLMEDIATCHYNGCPYADFGHWFFGVTGNIIACCLDLEEEIVLGNVLKDDPQRMFEKTDAFYKEQTRIQKEKLKAAYPVCANCYGQKREDLIQLGGIVA